MDFFSNFVNKRVVFSSQFDFIKYFIFNNSNPFASKDVRVTGTWPFDLGRINFDTCSDLRCIYAKSVTGLMSNTDYDWKVTIDGSYLDKYNFNGTLMTGQNCKAKTDLNGNVRIINI